MGGRAAARGPGGFREGSRGYRSASCFDLYEVTLDHPSCKEILKARTGKVLCRPLSSSPPLYSARIRLTFKKSLKVKTRRRFLETFLKTWWVLVAALVHFAFKKSLKAKAWKCYFSELIL